MEYVDVFLKAGELQDALNKLGSYLEDYPSDQEAIRLYASILSRIPGEEQNALDTYSHIKTYIPEDYIHISGLYQKLGAITEAIQTLKAGYAALPDDERLAEAAFHTFMQYAYFDAAHALVNDQLVTKFDSWQWQQHGGDLAAQTDDLERAYEHYTHALALIQKYHQELTTNHTIQGINARLYAARAGVLRRLKRYDEADEDYSQASEIVPDDAALHFNRGLVAADTEHYEKAKALLQSSLNMARSSQKPTLIKCLQLEYPQLLEHLNLN